MAWGAWLWVAWLWGACSLMSLPAANAASPVPYKLVASTVPEVPTRGSCGSLRLHILPAPGWVLKARAPFHGRVQTPAEVQVGNKLLSIHNVIDLRESHRTVAVPACFIAVGTFSVGWDLEFFLCTDHACEQQRITWEAAVQVVPGSEPGI